METGALGFYSNQSHTGITALGGERELRPPPSLPFPPASKLTDFVKGKRLGSAQLVPVEDQLDSVDDLAESDFSSLAYKARRPYNRILKSKSIKLM